jgi:hypothetical protein
MRRPQALSQFAEGEQIGSGRGYRELSALSAIRTATEQARGQTVCLCIGSTERETSDHAALRAGRAALVGLLERLLPTWARQRRSVSEL